MKSLTIAFAWVLAFQSYLLSQTPAETGPESWAGKNAAELLSSVDAYLAEGAIRTDTQLLTATKAILESLRDQGFQDAASMRDLLKLADRLTAKFGKWFTPEVKAELAGILEAKASS